MVGEPKYVPAEIYWILAEVLKKTKPDMIMSGYLELFRKTLNPTQIRYVKNKYGKDPDYNAPMINKSLKWKGDPQEIVPGYRRRRGYQSTQSHQPAGNMPTVAGPSTAISPNDFYRGPQGSMLETSPYSQATPANLIDQDYSNLNLVDYAFQGFPHAQGAYMAPQRSGTSRAQSISSQQDYMSPETGASGPSPYQYLNMPVSAPHEVISPQQQPRHQQILPQYSQSAATPAVFQSPQARRYRIPPQAQQLSPHSALDPHLFATYESPDEPDELDRPAKRSKISEGTYRQVGAQYSAPLGRSQVQNMRQTPMARNTTSQVASTMRRASISDSPTAAMTPKDSSLAFTAVPSEPQSQRRGSREPMTAADAHAHFISPSRRLHGGIYNSAPSPYVSSLRRATPRMVPQVMPYQSPAMPVFPVGHFPASVDEYNRQYQQLLSPGQDPRVGGLATAGMYVSAPPARGHIMTPGAPTCPGPTYQGAYPSARHLRKSQYRSGHGLQQSPVGARALRSLTSAPTLEQPEPSYVWQTPVPQMRRGTIAAAQMPTESRAVRETRPPPAAITQPAQFTAPATGSLDNIEVPQEPELNEFSSPVASFSAARMDPEPCINPALLSARPEQGTTDQFGTDSAHDPGMATGNFGGDPLMAVFDDTSAEVPVMGEAAEFVDPGQAPVQEAVEEDGPEELAEPIESNQLPSAPEPHEVDTSGQWTFEDVLQIPEATVPPGEQNAAPVEGGIRYPKRPRFISSFLPSLSIPAHRG